MPKEFDPIAMDNAANEAEQELTAALTENQELAPGIDYMINWWQRWFTTSGHKRLGRMLVNMAKEQKEG